MSAKEAMALLSLMIRAHRVAKILWAPETRKVRKSITRLNKEITDALARHEARRVLR